MLIRVVIRTENQIKRYTTLQSLWMKRYHSMKGVGVQSLATLRLFNVHLQLFFAVLTRIRFTWNTLGRQTNGNPIDWYYLGGLQLTEHLDRSLPERQDRNTLRQITSRQTKTNTYIGLLCKNLQTFKITS